MDGNGRWAKQRRHSRVYGHLKGAKVAKSVIEECARLKVPYLTLFAFSTENWFRPLTEVKFLMLLLLRQLQRERETLMRDNIRFCTIGDLEKLPANVRQVVLDTVEETAGNTGMILTFALSYGGRQEITQMVKEVARRVAEGGLCEEEIDDAQVAAMLPSSFLPDPDLIIRTSGESRISNFFLWQSAYSEIVFEEKPWPDFLNSDLHRILKYYAERERRFGRTSEQLTLR
jgi:undecaprenyl diphosphate synthase